MQENLFEIVEERSAEMRETLISSNQVHLLRQAFEAAGINSMEDRRELIESCTIRSVATIRELLARDVRPILRRIQDRSATQRAQEGSTWDNREEETWIDKL